MSPVATLLDTPTLIVLPWNDDALVADPGHDPLGQYAELFVLPVLGPTATWLLRRFVQGLEAYPDGYELDLAETAQALGLSFRPAQPNLQAPFPRAVHRCIMFGYARPEPYGLAVRRTVPTLAPRQVERLPPHLRRLHRSWAGEPVRASASRTR